MNNIQEISADQVVDLTMESNAEVVFNGTQANVIKGNNGALGDYIIVNLPTGDSLLIPLPC